MNWEEQTFIAAMSTLIFVLSTVLLIMTEEALLLLPLAISLATLVRVWIEALIKTLH